MYYCIPSSGVSQTRRSGDEMIRIGELVGRTNVQKLTNTTYHQSFYLDEAQKLSSFVVIQNSKNSLTLQIPYASGATTNYPQTLRYVFFDSEWSLISALILEKIDFARLMSDESALEIAKSNRSIHILSELIPSNTVTMIVFNCRHPIFGRPEVRQALSFAIERQKIINKLLKLRADVAKGPYNSDFEAYENSLDDFRYNPKKAIRILSENGWYDQNKDGILEDGKKNPLKLTLMYRKGLNLDEELIRWIKINWNQIGIDVQPLPLKYSALQEKLETGQFNAVLMDYQFEANIQSMIDFFSKNGKYNYMGYVSNKLENYINLFQKIDSESRQKILFQSIQKTINQDQPAIFLYFKWLIFNFVNRNRIMGYLDEKGNLRPVYEWRIKSK